MGIDLIRGGRIPNRGRRDTKTSNTYLKTLIKVYLFKCSFIHFYQEEQIPNSTRPFIRDLINQGLTVIQFLFQEFQEFFLKIVYLPRKKRLNKNNQGLEKL
jgi:hypothetical protein